MRHGNGTVSPALPQPSPAILPRGWDAVVLQVLCVLPFVQLGWAGQQRELPRHALVQAVAFMGLALAWWQGRVDVRRPHVRGAAVLALALLMGVLASDSPGRSLAGAYEGHAGVLALWAWLALLVAPPRAALLAWACRMLAAVGVVQGAWCLVQNQQGQAVRGSMGHPMFVAMLAVVVGLVALGVWVEERGTRWRVLGAAGLVAAGLVLVMAARRGPLLAWGGGAVLCVAWMGRQARARSVVGVGLCALGGALGQLVTHQAESLGHRLRDTGVGFAVEQGFDTAAQRLDFYRVALERIPFHPWLGAGFGTFGDHYAAHKAPHIQRFEQMVHNVVLDLLFSGGAVALLGAVVLLASLVTQGRRVLAVPHETAGRALSAAVLAMGVAHLVQWQFNFDQPGCAAWVWALLGMVLAQRTGDLRTGEPPGVDVPPQAFRRAWAVVPAALSLLTPWTLAAEVVASGALVAEAQGNLDRAATLHALAARMVPHECQHALNAAASAERADAVRSAPMRVETLERCARLEPHNAFVLHHLGRARAAAGRPDAVEALRRAVEASPQDALFRVGLARALLREGNAQEALVHARQAVALEPDTAACQRALADVHLTLGHTRQANEARGRADALGRHGP